MKELHVRRQPILVAAGVGFRRLHVTHTTTTSTTTKISSCSCSSVHANTANPFFFELLPPVAGALPLLGLGVITAGQMSIWLQAAAAVAAAAAAARITCHRSIQRIRIILRVQQIMLADAEHLLVRLQFRPVLLQHRVAAASLARSLLPLVYGVHPHARRAVARVTQTKPQTPLKHLPSPPLPLEL